jgi:glycolate oxidase
MTGGLVDALTQALRPDAVVHDPDVVLSLSADQAAWAPVGRASAVVRARDEAEVLAAVRLAAEHGAPVVPRGAGTGLSGGANALDRCVVLDVSGMRSVVELDTDNLLAVVQPGVVNNDLKAAVAEHGLWYPPDPASAPWSTIGGNVATNAGGLCCLKYGVTRDYVTGLRAVVAGGDGRGAVAELGHRTNKGVAGYDLVSLMVGSEGTLGVITEVTLRLRPAPTTAPRTIVGAFGSLAHAGAAVAAVTRAGLVPSALELLDRTCLRAVEEWKGLGLEADAAALLLARVDTAGDTGDGEAEAVAGCFASAAALWVMQSTDEQEAEALFQARRLAFPALERLGPVLTEDLCVPRSRLPEVLDEVEEIGRRHDVVIATIAHAGDGNLHPLLLTEAGDEAGRLRAHRAFDELIELALAVGGTVTGEHGVGILKHDGMLKELHPEALRMQRAVKAALDPFGLFNPGKAV